MINCLVSVLSQSASNIPRPLADNLYALSSNEVFHSGNLYLSDSKDGSQYFFVVKDDFSGLAYLSATTNESAKHSVEVLFQ